MTATTTLRAANRDLRVGCLRLAQHLVDPCRAEPLGGSDRAGRGDGGAANRRQRGFPAR